MSERTTSMRLRKTKRRNIQRNIKVTVVGDKAVGKTALLKTYSTGRFPKGDYISTVFPFISDEDYVYSKPILYSGLPLLLNMWDRVYNKAEDDLIRSIQYDRTDVFLLCFSVVNKQSFINTVSIWKAEIQRHCPKVPCILVGLKKDLRDSTTKEVITWSIGWDMAEKIGAVAYLECSSKKKECLKDVFTVAVQTAMNSPPKKRKKRKNSLCFSKLLNFIRLI